MTKNAKRSSVYDAVFNSSDEEFVKIWMEHYRGGRAAVVRAMGLGESADAGVFVSTRATRLRSTGTRLPKMPTGRKRMKRADPTHLNRIVDSYANKKSR